MKKNPKKWGFGHKNDNFGDRSFGSGNPKIFRSKSEKSIWDINFGHFSSKKAKKNIFKKPFFRQLRASEKVQGALQDFNFKEKQPSKTRTTG